MNSTLARTVVLVLASATPGAMAAQVMTTTTQSLVTGTVEVQNSGVPPVWRADSVTVVEGGARGAPSFGKVVSVTADSAGNIPVADGQALQIHVFDRTGRYVRTTPAGPADTALQPRTGSPPATLDQGMLRCPTPDGGVRSFSPPFRSEELNVAAPWGGTVVALTRDYHLVWLSPSGDVTRTVDRAYLKNALTTAMWDSATTELRDFRKQWPDVLCAPLDFQRPTARPALRALFIDPAGDLWVEVLTEQGYRFDIFGEQGPLLATIPAPVRDTTVRPYVRDNRLYLVARDGSGVQSVHVYQIQR